MVPTEINVTDRCILEKPTETYIEWLRQNKSIPSFLLVNVNYLFKYPYEILFIAKDCIEMELGQMSSKGNLSDCSFIRSRHIGLFMLGMKELNSSGLC